MRADPGGALRRLRHRKEGVVSQVPSGPDKFPGGWDIFGLVVVLIPFFIFGSDVERFGWFMYGFFVAGGWLVLAAARGALSGRR